MSQKWLDKPLGGFDPWPCIPRCYPFGRLWVNIAYMDCGGIPMSHVLKTWVDDPTLFLGCAKWTSQPSTVAPPCSGAGEARLGLEAATVGVPVQDKAPEL